MAADNRRILQGLLANTEKAVKRGKKLERTLIKIIAQSDAGSGAEEFLKSAQQGVKKLKKDLKGIEHSISSYSRKKKTFGPTRAAPNPDVPAVRLEHSVKRSRKKPHTLAEDLEASAVDA